MLSVAPDPSPFTHAPTASGLYFPPDASFIRFRNGRGYTFAAAAHEPFSGAPSFFAESTSVGPCSPSPFATFADTPFACETFSPSRSPAPSTVHGAASYGSAPSSARTRSAARPAPFMEIFHSRS